MSIIFQNPQLGPPVSQISMQYGWLMYASPDNQSQGREMVLHGEVMQFELSHNWSTYGNAMDVRFMLAGAKLLTGRPVDQMVGEALQKYPGNGRELPPQLKAMTELARRHPGEYRDLCDQFGLPPLLVVRDAWTGG